MVHLSRKNFILLVLLTLCWGINWPVMKLGVQDYPPLTFRVMGMLLGLPAIAFAARLQGVSLAIRRDQLKTVLILSVPNMMVWHIFIILGVKMLSSGRAAILGYTMPVWALLAGLLFFGDKVTRMAWIGVGCALAGAVLLLSNEFSALSGQPLGSLLALIAAAGWGYGTVAMKRTKIDIPTVSLTFWMLAVTTPLLLILAVAFEFEAWKMPNMVEWAAIVFNGLLVFGFAHVVWFQLARTLPPVASSLSVMMIPVVGVFSGAWLLNEVPHWQDYGAMVLILISMSTVLLKRQEKNPI
ncbi:MAG: EamA family transporter [Paucimonas sp.]|jgi:drug/metabolite transporter (DMT)-like permease|nr:EamA family transporter [Paucimonas sp.]